MPLTRIPSSLVDNNFTANTVLFANGLGYLSNTSNFQYFSGNNTIAVGAVVAGGIDVISYTQAAFSAANAAGSSAYVQSAYNQANVTIGVDATQNTQIAGLQGVNLATNSAITIIQGTNLTQNNSIAAAFTQANSVYLPSVTRLDVTNSGSSGYLFDQYTGNNPTLSIRAGETLAFSLGVTGYPFLIRVSNGGSNYNTGLTHVTTTGTVTTGDSAQGQVTGTLYWKVPAELAGNTYVYQCQVYSGMVGNIVIEQNIGTAASVQHNSLGIGTAASGVAGEIRAINNITAYYSSDRKYKENITTIPNALNKVDAIGGKMFDWTNSYIQEHGGEDGYFVQKRDFGVIAQDVQAVFPEAVRTREDGSLAVDYSKLSALAFAAIVELKKEIEQPNNPPAGFKSPIIAVQSDVAGIEWTYVDGIFIVSPKPAPNPEQLIAQCKATATNILDVTDWTAIPDVADPLKSNPYLMNQPEFVAYRSTVRNYAVNPVVDPVFPTIPTAEWSTIHTYTYGN